MLRKTVEMILDKNRTTYQSISVEFSIPAHRATHAAAVILGAEFRDAKHKETACPSGGLTGSYEFLKGAYTKRTLDVIAPQMLNSDSVLEAFQLPYRTTPKMAQRKQAHRAKLLGTAIRLFGRDGYHATTVPVIVREAETSTGSFYFYFHNKEDIFAAALEAIGKRIANALNEAIAAAGSDVLMQMAAAVERLIEFMAENPSEARILIVESSGLGLRLERVRRNIIDSHALSVELALSALSDTIPPVDRSIAARCWVGAVYEAVYHWLEEPVNKRRSPQTLAKAVAQFNLRAIGAPTKAAKSEKSR